MFHYNPFSPVDIRFLEKVDALEQLKLLVSASPDTVILLSEGIQRALGLGEWLTETINEYKIIHIGAVPANPTISDVSAVLRLLVGVDLKQVISIGGGSCIDLGKAVCALHGLCGVTDIDDEWVRNTIAAKQYTLQDTVPTLIAVPTTSGTGSEATRWATIWDMERRQKLSVDSVLLFPQMALMVPAFTLSLSQRLTLSTGLDALSHAMEAFWARSHTPLSQALAIAAVQAVHQNLPYVLEYPDSLDFRSKMCVASLMAGLAFSLTRTTACHSISYPLTMNFGVEHGFATALTLAQIAAENVQAVPEIEELMRPFGGVDRFKRWIEDLSAPIQPLHLQAFGISESDIENIATQAFTQGRMDNNPVDFSKQQVKSILQQCL